MRRRPLRSAPPTVIATTSVLALTAALLVPGVASAADGPELIANGTFDDGHAPWFVTEDTTPDASSGELCVDVPGGSANPWSTIVGLDGVPIATGENYRLGFTLRGTVDKTIRVLVQMNEAPWDASYEFNPTVTDEAMTYELGFAGTMDWPEGQLVFQVGGSEEDWTFCVDDVTYRTGEPMAAYEADTGSPVRVNQHGYLPSGPRIASVVSESTTPLAWHVEDVAGAEVAAGTTEPLGIDPSADESVHRVDLSALTAQGEGFVLVVGEDRSEPFDVRADLYDTLRRDALAYFYLARSGIEIDPALAGAEYGRPAGHVDVAPNLGDGAVGCQAPASYYGGWTCEETFDVTGGWYDAGDHGKYVVNGGIAVHQVLDTWERALVQSGREVAQAGPLGDGTASIPEAGNGVPDVLDEARWQLEWMMKMQVPAGMEYAGMAFHKVHDESWTGLPLLPHLDDKVREVHRPSTAATLNLAAVAAKGARLWEPYDATFAASLLEAARTAWQAALDEPALYALALDGDAGGGPYDDADVSDEFYWAAAELFLTTGEAEFSTYVEASELHLDPLTSVGGFSWGSTAALGRLDLALVESPLASREEVRELVVGMGDFMLGVQQQAFFGQPYAPADHRFRWGSNSMIVNNAVVLASAYDVSGEARFRDGALESVDYLFGRNALNQSYVTGYGERDSRNQHHRWMAAQLDSTLPHPSPGTLAGGPNSEIQDPVAKQTWPDGCVAQKCYLDDIQSWSTNEMTVNWNSALTWLAAWSASDGGQALGPVDVPAPGQDAGPDDASDALAVVKGAPAWVWVALLLAAAGAAVVAVLVRAVKGRGRASGSV